MSSRGVARLIAVVAALSTLSLMPSIPVAQADDGPERVLIGRSVQGRPLWAFQVGDPTASRVVVLLGQTHGDEHAGRITATESLKKPVKGVSYWVIPTINPDGDARRTRRNAHGVDLNRNWSVNWKPAARSSNYYSGPKPFSEPETRALRDFLNQVDPTFVVSIHQPLNGVDSSGPKAHALQRRLSRALDLRMSPFHCNGTCNGTMTQWIDRHLSGSGVVIEYDGWHPSSQFVRVKARRAILLATGGHY